MDARKDPAKHQFIGSKHPEEKERLEQLLRMNEIWVRELQVQSRICYFCGRPASGTFFELSEQGKGYPHYVANDCYQQAMSAQERN